MNTRESATEETYRDHYPVIAPLVMCKGVGDGRTTACVVAQAATIDALRKGYTLDEPTDKMECACPLLRRLAIRLNDGNWWDSDHQRTEILRPLIPMLLDSRVDAATTQKRIFFVADNSVRVLTPIRLEFRAKHAESEEWKASLLEGAKALRELEPITSKETAMAARTVCEKFRSSAYAAYAYASAASAAYAAYAYASADASADDSADASAYSYASAEDPRRLYRDMLLDLFRSVAAIKD